MKSRSRWGAKLALACYLVLFVVVLTVYAAMRSIGLGFPFPIGLVVVPIEQIIFVAITLFFATYKGAGFKELGLKKVTPKTLTIVSIVAVLLYLLSAVIMFVLTNLFGSPPRVDEYIELIMPRDSFQLIALVFINLAIVGICEELAFRGFIQKGFQNSFGKIKGLLTASVLFGLPHVFNSPYNVATAFVGGLFLGYVWQKTDENTTASAVMHGLLNSISFILAYLIGRS